MLAAYYVTNGAARDVLKLGEVETPSPGPGEVRVRLATSGVNPSDVKSRAGRDPQIACPRVIPHSDGAGGHRRVGTGVPRADRRAGLDLERPVEAAVRDRGRDDRAAGGAGRAAAAGHELRRRRLPRHPGADGLRAVTVDGAIAGTTVLVAGGAGAVGHYAIQFARRAARPSSPPSVRPRRPKRAREAGADHVVDYRREDVVERVVATGRRGVDAWSRWTSPPTRCCAGAFCVPRGHGRCLRHGPSRIREFPAQFLLVNAIAIRFVYVYELTPAEREAAHRHHQSHA